jgi:hypothetical protein
MDNKWILSFNKITFIGILILINLVNSADGAIVDIPNWTSGLDINGESTPESFSVIENTTYYLTGKMTFIQVGYAAGDYSYFELSFDDDIYNTAVCIGVPSFEKNTFSLIDYSTNTTTPLNGLTSNYVDNDVVSFALKVDQVAGQFTFWHNPNFNELEADQNLNGPTVTTGSTGIRYSAINSAKFKHGGSWSSGQSAFENFKIYTGTDTPFIPEPSSYALILGSLILLSVGIMRRSKAGSTE